MMNKYSYIGAIILAGGRGSRMGSDTTNKVALPLQNKPIVQRIVHMFQKLGVPLVIVVVGFAKDSVMWTLRNDHVIFAEQKEQLGTGHATAIGLGKAPNDIRHIFVIYGDDATVYKQELLTSLVDKHLAHEAVITFVTCTVSDPSGLGRIVRDGEGKVKAIVEEKNATPEQKKITEVNTGLYLFDKQFLAEYLHLLTKNDVTGEYYLTESIELALRSNKLVETVEAGNIPWRGVNTLEELQEAENMMHLSSYDNS